MATSTKQLIQDELILVDHYCLSSNEPKTAKIFEKVVRIHRFGTEHSFVVVCKVLKNGIFIVILMGLA